MNTAKEWLYTEHVCIRSILSWVYANTFPNTVHAYSVYFAYYLKYHCSFSLKKERALFGYKVYREIVILNDEIKLKDKNINCLNQWSWNSEYGLFSYTEWK